MKYLVQGSFIDSGVLVPREQIAQMVEHAIVPSLEALAQLERDGTLLGGLLAGARGGVFVVEAGSNDEVSDLVRRLPFWGLLSWEITPLEGFAHRLESDRAWLESTKTAGA